MEDLKKCSKCGVEHPRTIEWFRGRKDSKDGFRGECRSCGKKKQREYYEENKDELSKYNERYYREHRCRILNNVKSYYKDNVDKVKQYQKTYYMENREKVLEYQREYASGRKEYKAIYDKMYREENIDRIRERGVQYRLRNAEYIKKAKLKYRIENRETIRERNNQWREENREIINKRRRENQHNLSIYCQRRRSRKNNLPSDLTKEDWSEIKGVFNNECSYCGMGESEHIDKWGERLHQEHVIPLSKGGPYVYENIIPACKFCNLSKGNKDMLSWYRSKSFYSKDRELKILSHTEKRKGVEV